MSDLYLTVVSIYFWWKKKNQIISHSEWMACLLFLARVSRVTKNRGCTVVGIPVSWSKMGKILKGLYVKDMITAMKYKVIESVYFIFRLAKCFYTIIMAIIASCVVIIWWQYKNNNKREEVMGVESRSTGCGWPRPLDRSRTLAKMVDENRIIILKHFVIKFISIMNIIN